MTSGAQASGPAARRCDGAAFRAFDFWVGEWEVRDRDGKLVGVNSVSLEHNGCVVIERWRAASGNTGLSMNYYDREARLWRQNWVSPGVILQMSGGMQDNAMTLEGPLQDVPEERVTLLRGVWSRLPDGRLRQLFTESSDGGKTWHEWFDGYYTPVKKKTTAE
jgi:hypothetical protein